MGKNYWQTNQCPPHCTKQSGSSCRAGRTDTVVKMPTLPAALVKDKLRKMENKVHVRGGFHMSTLLILDVKQTAAAQANHSDSTV